MGAYDDFCFGNTASKKKSFLGILIGTCFKLMMVFLFILLLVTGFTNPMDTDKVIDIDLTNIPDPIQYSTSGGTSLKINGGTADITYVAEYVLNGRVVDVQLYGGSSIQDKLSPKDIGVAWGELASDESRKKVRWSSSGNRFLYWNISDGTWYKEQGGKTWVTTHHSNNHLIPSNDEIAKLVKKIKEDDYVQVTGYLVKINWKNDEGRWFKWNTSTSRNDDGDGACEIIYVTDVKWLK